MSDRQTIRQKATIWSWTDHATAALALAILGTTITGCIGIFLEWSTPRFDNEAIAIFPIATVLGGLFGIWEALHYGS